MNLVRYILIYTFYYVFFIIFYYVFLEILRFKICIENCGKSKWEEQKEIDKVLSTNTIKEYDTCQCYKRAFPAQENFAK